MFELTRYIYYLVILIQIMSENHIKHLERTKKKIANNLVIFSFYIIVDYCLQNT